MRRLSSFSPLFVAGCVLCLLLSAPAHSQETGRKSPFWTGADLSALPYQEGKGIKYFDEGQESDLIDIARRNGWKLIRVRLWVNPADKPFDQASSLASVTALGKRIKAAGLQFLLDIHYSDTWADPGQQKKPAVWDGLDFPQLVEQVGTYSRDVVAHLRENGTMPDMVQVGNETRNGLLYGSSINKSGPQVGGGFWENDKGGIDRAVQLLKAGLNGVRAGAAPLKPPITMIHVPDGQEPDFVKWYFSTLEEHARALQPAQTLDFDMVGLSYYPGEPWDHKVGYDGWLLPRLIGSMNYVATTLHKPVMVVETNWPHAGEVLDIPGKPQFAFTPEGQAQFYQSLIRAVRAIPDGRGAGVMAWASDTLNWQSVFDSKGHSLPAVRALGEK